MRELPPTIHHEATKIAATTTKSTNPGAWGETIVRMLQLIVPLNRIVADYS
jgi:hypothetical protein